MRALRALAGIAALTAGLSLPAIMSGGAGMPRFVRTPRAPGEERVDPKTKRAREKGKAKDPFYGIASRGRRGAGARARLVADALAKTARGRIAIRTHGGKVKSKPFHSGARNDAFVAALNAGETHNGALKLARRVPA